MNPFRIERKAEVDAIVYKKLHPLLFGDRADLRSKLKLSAQREVFLPKLNRTNSRPARFPDHLRQGTSGCLCSITDEIDFEID